MQYRLDIQMTDQNKKNLQIFLKRGFSSKRLSCYRNTGEGDVECLTRYLWNIALSESLYPAMQCLEVSLRNSIHVAISEGKANQYWFEDSAYIAPAELNRVADARQILQRQRKHIDADRIIAELNFGFWTALFDSRYEQILWHRYLRAVFPSMPRQIRSRISVSQRLNKIRYLRNRVFHYEPIWHWRDLRWQHDGIIEVTGWLNDVAAGLALAEDRFVDVYRGGPQRYHATVVTMLAQYTGVVE